MKRGNKTIILPTILAAATWIAPVWAQVKFPIERPAQRSEMSGSTANNDDLDGRSETVSQPGQ